MAQRTRLRAEFETQRAADMRALQEENARISCEREKELNTKRQQLLKDRQVNGLYVRQFGTLEYLSIKKIWNDVAEQHLKGQVPNYNAERDKIMKAATQMLENAHWMPFLHVNEAHDDETSPSSPAESSKKAWHVSTSDLHSIMKVAKPPLRERNFELPQKLLNADPWVLKEEARTKLGLDFLKYNFSFVGVTGVGKSSLVNSLRGLTEHDKGAASVDIREQHVQHSKPRPYPDPRLPHIVFWDVPGSGTQSNPSETYFKKQQLYAFDCLVIVFDNRIFKDQVDIVKKAKEFGLPACFVRSKADEQVRNLKKRKQCASTEECVQKLKSETTEYVHCELKKGGVSTFTPVFCLSSPKMYEIVRELQNGEVESDGEIPQVGETDFLKFAAHAAYSAHSSGGDDKGTL